MGSKKISKRKDLDLDLNKYFSNLKLKDKSFEANLVGKEFDLASGWISFPTFWDLVFYFLKILSGSLTIGEGFGSGFKLVHPLEAQFSW